MKPLTAALTNELFRQNDVVDAVADLQRRIDDEAERRARFLDELTPSMKCEFIEGHVVMHSPSRKRHVDAGQYITTLLRVYAQIHSLAYVGPEKLLVRLSRNDFEPDVCLFVAKRTRDFTPDQMLFPAPDLVVEILATSTAARDRGIKYEDYAAHGVREYWIVDAVAEVVERHTLTDTGTYQLLEEVSDEMTLTSEVLAGFAVPVAAAFDGAANVETLFAMRM